jgi:hypothetical protein
MTTTTETQAKMSLPVVTENPKPTCPVARFGRPHLWVTGAFYWPLGGKDSTLYVGDDYAMCASCGQIEVA